MADEITPQEVEVPETPAEEPEDDLMESVWKELFGEESASEELEEVAEETEKKYAKQDNSTDKKLRAIASVMDSHIREEKAMKAYNDAIAGMNDLERDIALTLLKPNDDPSVISKKVGLIKAQAQKVQERVDEEVNRAMTEAQNSAAAAWALPTVVPAAGKDMDEEAKKQLDERIAKGDPLAMWGAFIASE